jgi:predicted 2-oxoglutarate/Fe(II)-dependent dioxygenase YbiX
MVDESRRRTRRVLVPDAAQRLIEERLLAIVPEVRQHFGVAIGRMQLPQFLRYRRGDFFRAHQDSSRSPEIAAHVRRRRVSAVVFLNRQTRFPEAEAFCGGDLKLYRADDDPDPGLHVLAEDGLLLAFPSGMFHEVRPVTHGERYTVVTWFEGDSE